jgi:RNA polymerase sigma-70 factor (ECF subfamily)
MSTSQLEALFLEAYDAHADAIFRFCYAHTGDRDRAKDAMQETFMRTWAYLARGKRIDALRPFLYRTARNLLIDLSRRSTARSLDALQEEGFDAADERGADPATAAEAARAVRLASMLDEPYRDAVLLRYVNGLTPREIAEITEESENAVSVRIHRGLEKLRDLMKIERP